MAFKNFAIQVILRIILLFGLLISEAYVIFVSKWPITGIIIGVFCVALMIEIIRYVTKTNRDLSTFLQSVRHHDFTASFSSGRRGPSFDGLKNAFNDIIHEFRLLEAEKESHHHYLQTVIEHIGVALICIDQDEEVSLMNKAAQDLLEKPYMKRIAALERIDENMLKVIRRLGSGEKELVKVVVNGELRQIAIRATEFMLMETEYKLLSLQDIRSELDSREVEAWQKLIRVLTHEIMNSVTPLSTLSGVMKDYLVNEKGELLSSDQLDQETMEDMLMGLTTIESRTRGLLKFVTAYRSLLKIPKPNFREVVVQDLVTRICMLLHNQLKERQIELRTKLPEKPVRIMADDGLIEQVLINLIKNAMEAVASCEGTFIEVAIAQPKPTRTLIQVRDNGCGIEEEHINNIFVPFFTTKKEGTGIGLSLSRQIMRLHKGSITVKTEVGEGTLFTLEF